jgi:hypothetical protein
VVLIQEDMKVCDETVRQILQVGAHLGRHCTMMYKAYSELPLCNDASSMSEMVWELRSRAPDFAQPILYVSFIESIPEAQKRATSKIERGPKKGPGFTRICVHIAIA